MAAAEDLWSVVDFPMSSKHSSHPMSGRGTTKAQALHDSSAPAAKGSTLETSSDQCLRDVAQLRC